MKLPNKKNRHRLTLSVIAILASLLIPIKAANAASETEILPSPWVLTGNNGAVEKYQSIDKNALVDKDSLKITYNLHGTCLLDGDASILIFDQPIGQDWRFVNLSKYGKNCYDGTQTVNIPLSDFGGLNKTQPVGAFHVRFWNRGNYRIDINSVKAASTFDSGSGQTTTPTQFSGFKGEYWNTTATSSPSIPTGNPDLLRDDQNINFTWNENSPASSIHNDHFVARWTKTKHFDAGNYKFTTISDDGVRLWVDDQIVLDNWTDHGSTTNSGEKYLSTGDHNIRIEYYENGGGAVMKYSESNLGSGQPATPTNPPAPQVSKTWDIQSVSSMKETKDKICGQDDQSFIEKWVDKAKELGVNYVAVETPYDNVSCGNSVDYTKKWIDVIRSRGLKVWHRHMFTSFEGIYNSQKTKDDYLTKTANYIKSHPDFFAPGDIFTPQPEPQNGGIAGFTGCDQGVCQYSSIADFNKWLRDAIDVSNQAFNQVGLNGQIKVGYYGLDGFIVWGSNNPDWHGILEESTVQKMGNITIDHYPELIGQTMEQGLNELQAKYPNTPIIIGEWGSAGSSSVEQQVINSMGAAKRSGIVGFNYWHMGMGGNESLINSDFSNRAQYDEVQSYFKGQR